MDNNNGIEASGPEHRWTAKVDGGEVSLVASEEIGPGGLAPSIRIENAPSGVPLPNASVVSLFVGELLRLAKQEAYLELRIACLEGTLAMAVARLGGIVEGAPTHRGNFLQRIDQLVMAEQGPIAPSPQRPTPGQDT